MNEVWNSVAGYEGWYEVSNLGNVRSIPRHITQECRWGLQTRLMAGRLMRPTDNGNGYLIVSLRKGSEKRKNHYVHRLVAAAFCDNPNSLECVNHIDENKRNNAAENLEWITQQGNVLHSIERMRKPRRGAKSATGEKYIYFRDGRYRFSYKGVVDKTYPTLADAVSAREVFFDGGKYLTRSA